MAESRTIAERLADELSKTGDFSLRQPAEQAISVPGPTVDALTRTVKQLKDHADRITGRGGSVLDRAMTFRDLLQSGAMRIDIGGQTYGDSSGGPITFPPPGTYYPDPRPYYDVPPAPTSLSALGAFRNVMLDWDLVNYQNHAYVEVWRNSVNTLGTATKIGVSSSNMYADASGTSGSTYYYWVRAVNIEGVQGPFNAVSGVSATLARIETADYQNLSIVNAAIANLAVDDAKIANMNVSKLEAGALVAGEYIQSHNYTPGVAGFRIGSATGTVDFRGGLIGGATIAANYVQSNNYVAGTSGWKLDNASGTLYANDIELNPGTATLMDDGQRDILIDPIAASATSHTVSSDDVITLTTTGEPVTVHAVFTIVPAIDTTTVGLFRAQVTMTMDGGDEGMPMYGSGPVISNFYGTDQSSWISIPHLLRLTPSAGAHDYGFEVEVTWYTSSGVPVAVGAGGGTLTVNAYFVGVENRI